jgi:Tfp pilus assembly protein PilF
LSDLAAARARREQGDLRGAAEACRAVLAAVPDDPEALHLLALVLSEGGQSGAAIPLYARAIAVGGTQATLLYNYGAALREARRFVEAARAFRLAIDAGLDDAETWFALGNVRAAQGEHAEAEKALVQAAERAPTRAEIWNNLGLARLRRGNAAEAITAFAAAVRQSPDYIEARLMLGLAEQRSGLLSRARATFEDAVRRAPENASAQASLGNVLRDLGEFPAATACFAMAFARAPDDPELIGNRALALQHAGDLDGAVTEYRRALTRARDHEGLRFNLAQALLLAGRYDEGWVAFESRLADPEIARLLADLPGERWGGEDLSDRSILLRCEQGLGDALQFVRYVPVLAERGARVHLMGPARLAPVMKTLRGLASYLADDTPPPAVDFHAPLLSVPHLLGGAEIPADVPYLAAEQARVDTWRQILGATGQRLIGVAWQGNPSYAMDYLRSIPSAFAAELRAEIEAASGAKLVILQQGAPGAPALDADGAFLDTAAIMQVVDLVITSDTAIPHLAGALARPVWMLLPSAPDWRWGLGTDVSPWYPTMRIFRQPHPGDWRGVFHLVAAALKNSAWASTTP